MKSNMGAARMRRANRRIQFQQDAIRQTEARDYVQQRKTVAATVPSTIRRIYIKAIKWITDLWAPPSLKAMSALDFRIDKGDRGRGARQLRAIFGQQLKMISTLDGKPV